MLQLELALHGALVLRVLSEERAERWARASKKRPGQLSIPLQLWR